MAFFYKDSIYAGTGTFGKGKDAPWTFTAQQRAPSKEYLKREGRPIDLANKEHEDKAENDRKIKGERKSCLFLSSYSSKCCLLLHHHHQKTLLVGYSIHMGYINVLVYVIAEQTHRQKSGAQGENVIYIDCSSQLFWE